MKREDAESMLRLSGFEIRHTWELANGYWPSALRAIEDRLRRGRLIAGTPVNGHLHYLPVGLSVRQPS